MRTLQLHRPLLVTALAMIGLIVVSAAGLALDDRTLLGVPIWLKPLKFSISITIYTLTIAWLLSLVQRGRRVGWWLGTGIAVAMVLEMVIIVGQVVRGRQSHFNVATALDATLYSTMGATIAGTWVATAAIAVLLMRQKIADRANALAVRGGLAVALLGMAIGFLMTRPTSQQVATMADQAPSLVGAHGVGVEDGGPGLPLVNWSTVGGDLRVGHFIGMHALQALPLLALALVFAAQRIRRLRDERVRLRLVAVAVGAYAGFTGLVTWQALRGQSLVHPDALTLAVAALLGVAVVGGTLWATRSATVTEAVLAR